jgi:hypothetical protein
LGAEMLAVFKGTKIIVLNKNDDGPFRKREYLAHGSVAAGGI